MTRTVGFVGISGTKYTYEVCDVNGAWRDAPGNYVFARYEVLDRWVPKYIGETQSFASRMPNHDMADEARKYGATHVLAHVNNGGVNARQTEERDLIAAYDPPCNTQHKGLGSLFRVGR